MPPGGRRPAAQFQPRRDKAVMRCRTQHHTDVLCFCSRGTIMQQHSPQKKRGSYDHSKLSLTSRTMAVINPPFISNFVWNVIHGRPNQWGQRTENNGGARPRGKQGNLRQFISCHRSGLCPAKNVGALPFAAPSQQHVRVFGQGAQISGGPPSPSEASSWRRGIGRPRLMERNVSYFCNVKQI